MVRPLPFLSKSIVSVLHFSSTEMISNDDFDEQILDKQRVISYSKYVLNWFQDNCDPNITARLGSIFEETFPQDMDGLIIS